VTPYQYRQLRRRRLASTPRVVARTCANCGIAATLAGGDPCGVCALVAAIAGKPGAHLAEDLE
jgi:hypothetical protein